MARTISNEDVEAIAQRVASILRAASPKNNEVAPDSIYTVAEAEKLVGFHPETLRQKLRARILNGRRKGGGTYRIRGA